MTIAALTETRVQISGDGVTETVAIPFQFIDQNDLTVIHTDALGADTEWTYQQSPGSWSFTGGDYGTGTLHFTAADCGSGERLTVVLVSAYDQPQTLEGGEIDPDVLQRSMDRTALQVQAIAGEVQRSLSVSPSLAGTLPNLEVPDLKDGEGFIRQGDGLVPALIDSAAISSAVTASGQARDVAQDSALVASDAAVSAGQARDQAQTARTDAQTARQGAEDARDEAVQYVDDAQQELGLGRMPIGTVLWVAGTTAPASTLALAGQTITRAAYPDLWTWVKASGNLAATEGAKGIGEFGPGDGSTTFTLPDLRDQFIRAYGDARDVGSYQDDALQNITASFGSSAEYRTGNGAYDAGAISTSEGDGNIERNDGSAATGGTLVEFDASNVVRTADETRPKNVAFLPVIVAYHVVIDAAQLQASEVLNDISSNTTGVADINTRMGSLAILEYQQPSGTHGGTPIAGAWTTYPLNTERLDPQGIVSLVGNDFTPTVDCEIQAEAGLYRTAGAVIRVYDVTGSSVHIPGASGYSRAADGPYILYTARGILTAGMTYRIEYNIDSAFTTYGLGYANGHDTEVFGRVTLRAI